jgi:hypothetical protein
VVDLVPAGDEAGDVAECRLDHRMAIFGGRDQAGSLLLPGNVRHHHQYDVEIERMPDIDRGHEMTQVRRVERPPEEPDPLRRSRCHEALCGGPTTSTIRHSTCGIARFPGFRR